MTYSILFSSHRLLKCLYILALAAVAMGLAYPWLGAHCFRTIERYFGALAGTRMRAVLIAALFPMLVRLLMLPWYPPPPPQIHDEYSYLLQGDTFAHGRVTNPTPPYWEHFETEYTLLHPTYASQYQPAQGLVLAFGEVVFRHPWWGVWLSMGLMCGVLCWALGEIVPPAWALAGALGAALQFGIFGLWMNSYFGGAVAATAGALVTAAIARIGRCYKAPASAALCAFGLILLFGTRPFEALLWSGIAGCYVLFYTIRKRLWTTRRFVIEVLLPFVLVFGAGSGALAWYNWRVTGNPMDPPYLAYQRIYGTPQPYWWQRPLTIASFHYPEIRDNYLNQRRLYEERDSIGEIAGAERARLANFWRFFVGPFFTPALLFLPWIFRDRRIRPWLLASIPFILAKATYHAWYPAHSAPETILIVLVLLECWRHMRAWGRRGAGVALSRALVAGLCLTVVLGNAGRAMEPFLLRHGLDHLPPIWESLYPAKRLRDDIAVKLAGIPGKHLLFVRYEPGHCFCEEWVFNSAELSEQRIIFARTDTLASDEALAQAFPDRDVWLMEPDEGPYSLVRVQSESQWALLEGTDER